MHFFKAAILMCLFLETFSFIGITGYPLKKEDKLDPITCTVMCNKYSDNFPLQFN